MTKREAVRQTDQENQLLTLGFSRTEAEQLRRISMTLQRWHEGECGSDSTCITRGRMVAGEFAHDDEGEAYREYSGLSGRNRFQRIPDREKGALSRLKAIIASVNVARAGKVGRLNYYIQGDPRGAALYIIRPGDVPEGADIDAYYTRGICVVLMISVYLVHFTNQSHPLGGHFLGVHKGPISEAPDAIARGPGLVTCPPGQLADVWEVPDAAAGARLRRSLARQGGRDRICSVCSPGNGRGGGRGNYVRAPKRAIPGKGRSNGR